MGKRVVLDALGREMVIEEEERRPEPEMNDKWLKIYVDEEKNKYYIDIFAAVELHLISYVEACEEYDHGGRYYLLTPTLLEHLKEQFKGRIKYYYFAKENEEKKDDNKDDYYGYETYQDYREKFGNVNNKADMPKYAEDNNINNLTEEFDNKVRR